MNPLIRIFSILQGTPNAFSVGEPVPDPEDYEWLILPVRIKRELLKPLLQEMGRQAKSADPTEKPE